MSETDAAEKPLGIWTALPFFYGWIVVALSFLANLPAAGIRSAPALPAATEFASA